MLTSLIFGASRNGMSYACQLCAEIPGLVILQSLEQLPKLHNLHRILNNYSPQLILMEVGEDETWPDLAQEILDLRSEISLIMFSVNARPEQISAAAGLGLQVMEAPISGESLQDAIFRAFNRGAGGREGRLLAFVTAKGGSGGTTTALGTAMVVARDLNKRVLFLECDVSSGPAAIYLGLESAARSIIEVLEDVELLDRTTVTELVSRAEGIDVLPSTGRRPTHKLSMWSFQRLISRARSSYDYVFCDLPEAMEEVFEGTLRAADQVFIVASASEPAVFLAGRRLASLSQLGVRESAIKIVLTRTQDRDDPIKYIKHLPVSVAIPNRPSLRDASRFHMKAVVDSDVEPEFRALAEICSGEKIAGAARRTGFGTLFSSALFGFGRTRSEAARG